MFPVFLSMDIEKKLSIISLICALILLGFLIIYVPFKCYSDFLLATSPVIKPPLTVSARQPPLTQEIANKHLFGDAMVAHTPLPITSLNLKLIGIIYSEPLALSHVIISELNQVGKIYKLHDRLGRGATIAEIQPDGVILENEGREEKLPLPRSLLTFHTKPSHIPRTLRDSNSND